MGGSRCAFVQGEIRIVGFTEGSKSVIIYCLTVSILQWFTRERAHTCLTWVRLLTESCIYKNLLASVLWISGFPVKQVGHLRGIDLLQDPIDPNELVSSLGTKASCFGVLIPRPKGMNLVAGLPPQDPSNRALEHGPRPRLKTWPWPTLVMTTFCGWWIDNRPLFPLLNTLHHSMGFYMTEYSSPMLRTHLWGKPLGYKFKPFQYKILCDIYLYIVVWYNKVIDKVKKTQHQNPEFGHKWVKFKKNLL